MIQSKNGTENLLLSITKNCETLNKQPHTKPQKRLELNMVKPRKTFHFNPPLENKKDG